MTMGQSDRGQSRPGAALIIGAGDGLGQALARRFAGAGYAVGLTRRDVARLAPLVTRITGEGGIARAYGSDAREEEQVASLFAAVEQDLGPLEVVIFNVGGNVRFPIRDTTTRVFRKVWEMACFAGFLAGREAARIMVPRSRGTILFTGATASVRGRDGFAAFAAAKHGLRAVAQSMARELGPRGIHVAHIVIDGAIDTPWIRENFPQVAERPGAMLEPDAIAEAFYQVHIQPPSAWTHEMDLRPSIESW